MREIIIYRVEDLQAGDIATMIIGGESYVGPITELEGDLFWAKYLVLGEDGTRGLISKSFKEALRELPPLPTKPLSVITDVVTTNGKTYPLAILRERGPFEWCLFDTQIGERGVCHADEIESFKLAKVVPA